MIPKENLQAKADSMSAYLQVKSGSEPNEIIERMENLSVMIIQAGDCLADAEYYRDSVISSETMKVIKEGYVDKVSMTVINNLIKALAKEENYLVKQFDRINSAAVHQLDGLRSILSYRKQEFATLSYGK